MITFQKTGVIEQITQEFIYVKVDGDIDEDYKPYPMHSGDSRLYKIGDSVLVRETVELLKENR